MTDPNVILVDERLVAVLTSALQRDPTALRNGAHLDALLADLSPAMPASLHAACVAAATADASNWLTSVPSYTEEQTAWWLNGQYPALSVDDVRQVVGAFAILSGARRRVAAVAPQSFGHPAFGQPAFGQPAFGQPAFGHPAVEHPALERPSQRNLVPPPLDPTAPTPATDRPGFGNMVTELPVHPSGPPIGGPPLAGPPRPPTPPPVPKRRKTWLILAAVAVVLVAAGVGTFFAVRRTGGSSTQRLAAPTKVSVMSAPGDGVMVSWHAVPGATRYHLLDKTGRLPVKDVRGTSYTFAHAAGEGHRFVVQAMDSAMTMSRESQVAVWKAKLVAAPSNVTAMSHGLGVMVSWDPVPNATGYQVTDLTQPGSPSTSVQGTSYMFDHAIYSMHRFEVKAVSGGTAGPASDVAIWKPRNDLSSAEQTLAYRLPATTARAGSCTSDSSVENRQGVVAAVQCNPPLGARRDGPAYLFVLQLSPGSLRSYVDTWFPSNDQAAGCTDSLAARGVHGTWSAQDNSPTLGDTVCFTDKNGGSDFVFTYNHENVLMQIGGGYPTTANGLYSWWRYHTPNSLP